MKKILVAMTTLYNGGAERSLVNFLTELPDDQYNVDLILFKKEGLFLSQVPEWVNILEAPNALVKLYSPLSKAGIYAPWKIVSNVLCNVIIRKDREKRYYRWKYFYSPFIPKLSQDYDVAISYVSGEVMYFVQEKVNARKKYVWIHNDYRTAGHPKKLDIPYFEQMNGIVTVSDKCLKILNEEFPQFCDKTYCVENITSAKGIQEKANSFDPDEISSEVPSILSIGRLSYQKGFDMALQGAKLLKNRQIVFKWYIIGTGELESELRNKIEELGLEGTVQLLGAKSNPYPYIKKCTVFVQTSRFEGKSVVIDEAKILNKPILATDYPTIHDQLQGDYNGMIVPISAEGIANGLAELLANQGLREKFSCNLDTDRNSNESEIKKYIEIIEK